MKSLPKTGQGRVLAISLLLIVLLTLYLLFVHWWFVVPFREARSNLLEQRSEEIRFRANAQQRPQIEEKLAEVRAFEAANPGFLAEANFDLAASALIQQLQNLVDAEGAGERCTLVSRTPFRSREPELFLRATIKVRMRCEMEHLASVLHGLESGSPQLFVGDLSITSRRTPARGSAAPGGYLDISFDLYGYLRQKGLSDG